MSFWVLPTKPAKLAARPQSPARSPPHLPLQPGEEAVASASLSALGSQRLSGQLSLSMAPDVSLALGRALGLIQGRVRVAALKPPRRRRTRVPTLAAQVWLRRAAPASPALGVDATRCGAPSSGPAGHPGPGTGCDLPACPLLAREGAAAGLPRGPRVWLSGRQCRLLQGPIGRPGAWDSCREEGGGLRPWRGHSLDALCL